MKRYCFYCDEKTEMIYQNESQSQSGEGVCCKCSQYGHQIQEELNNRSVLCNKCRGLTCRECEPRIVELKN